jgi:hypothetical protein
MKAYRDPHGAADTRIPIVAADPRERVKTSSSYQQRRERGRAAPENAPEQPRSVEAGA